MRIEKCEEEAVYLHDIMFIINHEQNILYGDREPRI